MRIDEGTAKLFNSNSNPIPLQPKLDGIFFKKKGNIQTCKYLMSSMSLQY